MSSIIELVGSAEAKAAEIRRAAQQDARDALARAEAEVADKNAAALEREREATRAALAEAEINGEAAAKDIAESSRAAAGADTAAAREKLDRAVNYLMERVVEVC